LEDRRRDGGTNYTLRIKEQGKHLTLNEHDDDDDDDDDNQYIYTETLQSLLIGFRFWLHIKSEI
jgi:hypothetical protein